MEKGGRLQMQYKYDVDLKSVGSHIKTARNSAGLNQKQLAEDLGIEQKYLSEVERGSACPSFPLMVAISDRLDVSIQFLTRGTDKIPSEQTIPKETLYYVPEASGLNERQYKKLLKMIRIMAETLKDEDL